MPHIKDFKTTCVGEFMVLTNALDHVPTVLNNGKPVTAVNIINRILLSKVTLIFSHIPFIAYVHTQLI